MLWALLLPYSAACPGHRAGPGPGTSSPAQGLLLRSAHSYQLESDLEECFHSGRESCWHCHHLTFPLGLWLLQTCEGLSEAQVEGC